MNRMDLWVDFVRNYPQYTAANLETQGVLPPQDTATVHSGHPIVALLRANEPPDGPPLLPPPGQDWYTVDREAYRWGVARLRAALLAREAAESAEAPDSA